jgi:hypothetical protein
MHLEQMLQHMVLAVEVQVLAQETMEFLQRQEMAQVAL